MRPADPCDSQLNRSLKEAFCSPFTRNASAMTTNAPSPDSQSGAIPPASETEASFASRVRSAVAWRWGTQVAAQIITWTSTFLVVRLLGPTDYGLFAMSQTMVVALTVLNGQSFATSMVQTDRLDDRRIGQVFGMLLVLAVTLATTQLILAPQAAAYYQEPLVADMLRLQAVIFLTIPFSALPQEWLARQLEFRKAGHANMASAVVGALVALGLAWMGWGVWALVYSGISMFVSRAIGLMIAAKLWVRPVFNPTGAWDLLTFGGTLTLCQIFWIVQSQSDVVIAGRFLSTYDLGLYAQAIFLALIVTARFIPPINEVALAAYSELHRSNKPLGPYFLKTARMVMMVSAPIYIGLALTAENTILVLMGDKWVELIPIFQGLTIVMPAFALQLICGPVTNAMGRPQIQLFTNISGALIFPTMFVWHITVGTMGLVQAWWIAAPLLMAVTLLVTLPRIAVSLVALINTLAPIALACAVMAIAVLLAQLLVPIPSPLLELIFNAALGACTYAAAFWFGYRGIVRETWDLLRNRERAPVV